MAYVSSKGLLYPNLQLSSFRVKREELPPKFELPPEVDQALAESVPPTRHMTWELKAVQTYENDLEETEVAKKVAQTAREAEAECLKMEIAEADKIVDKDAEQHKKLTRQLMNITQSNEADAQNLLESSGWDLSRAVQTFLDRQA